MVEASVDQQQWFPKGTGPEAGKTRALPEIWSKPDDFTAAQKMFSDRAPKLLAAARPRMSPPSPLRSRKSAAPARTATTLSARRKIDR